MNICEIELRLGHSLPNSYKNLLDSIEDYAYISFNEYPLDFPNDEGASWFMWGVERLGKAVEMDCAGKELAYAQLKLHTALDRRLRNRDYVKSPQGEIALDRVASGFVIAEDNGDLLYLDFQDEGSVWRYMHDSGDVRRLDLNFNEWMSRATL
ncbi:hypothetical protein GCM10007907_30180 [Chitinimonas prasina]|uniref:Knr4/Smi1-like domain-containing protein n=1 Tax=Chitinimonas prasina TaxID=1434937 RepID=A0ABQ5YKM8_9NEIS|nr:SMI1/KNR4 family protein [Chitinimonas prasina]GLR14228.1 hypothetical protein GCM10007907_30180 [Chitinimonas prasina]